MNIQLIPFGPSDKGWEVEVCFEVFRGCYATRLDISYIYLHSPDNGALDITEIWEELIPSLHSELKKHIRI